MNRTLDLETTEDKRRIQLIMDIVNVTSMSERLEIVKKFEEDIWK